MSSSVYDRYSSYSSSPQLTDSQKLDHLIKYTDHICAIATTLDQRVVDLENMMVDVNAGIDEILADRSHNRDDEKVCGCPETGCESCVTSGDTAYSAEPSSSGQEVS